MSQCTCGCGHGSAAVTIGAPAVTADTTIEQAKRRPGALAVLQRFGIDHCCGAVLPLREAAALAGARVEDVLSALAAADPRT